MALTCDLSDYQLRLFKSNRDERFQDQIRDEPGSKIMLQVSEVYTKCLCHWYISSKAHYLVSCCSINPGIPVILDMY